MTGPSSRLPDFLLVGAQKSGTTTLIRDLGTHPQVFTLAQEVHYFDRLHQRGPDWYASCFAGAGGALRVGESSPQYLYDPAAAPRIGELLGAPLLVAILRDPVGRAYSHYWHNRARGHEDGFTFEEAIAAEDRRITDADPMTRNRYSYLDRGRYLPQLRRMAAIGGRDRLHVVLFDDLRDQPEATLAGVYRFLGVDPELAPPRSVAPQNRYMNFRSMRLRGPIRRLPGPARRVAARLNVRYTTYPPMAPETRLQLTERFAADNHALATWLERDLGRWGVKERP